MPPSDLWPSEPLPTDGVAPPPSVSAPQHSKCASFAQSAEMNPYWPCRLGLRFRARAAAAAPQSFAQSPSVSPRNQPKQLRADRHPSALLPYFFSFLVASTVIITRIKHAGSTHELAKPAHRSSRGYGKGILKCFGWNSTGDIEKPNPALTVNLEELSTQALASKDLTTKVMRAIPSI